MGMMNEALSPQWYVLSSKSGIKSLEEQFSVLSTSRVERGGMPVEYFLPTCIEQSSRSGRAVIRRKKLIGSYIFIRDCLTNIMEMTHCVDSLWLLPHPDHDNGKRYMTISDHEMYVFKAVANAYANELPCYPIEAVDLEEGDLVQIVGGEFDGMKGRLRCSQGRNGGKVMMAVGNLFLISTPDIKPQYIRILQFGKGNRHPYRQFEAHVPRALQALRHQWGKDTSDGLTTEDLASMTVFTGRFEALEPATVNIASQHAALMLLSYAALQDKDKTERWLLRCRAILPTVKSITQRAWQLAFMFAATGIASFREEAEALVSSWTIAPNDRKRTLIATTLNEFYSIHGQKSLFH
jgi:transcription antitermination factor NusG